jgi:hypothetical protein
MIYISALMVVFITGGLIDFSTFDNIGLWNFMISSLAFTFTINLLTPIISAWLIYNSYGILFKTSTIIITIIFGTYSQMRELFTDLFKVIHMDLPIAVIPGAINWAIITDVTYSIYYLIPSIMLVIIQRWGFGRRMFLNLILFVADHPKGVLYAISQISTAWISAIVKLFEP